MLLKELRGKFDFYNTSQGEKGKFESISQRLKNGKLIVFFLQNSKFLQFTFSKKIDLILFNFLSNNG